MVMHLSQVLLLQYAVHFSKFVSLLDNEQCLLEVRYRTVHIIGSLQKAE